MKTRKIKLSLEIIENLCFELKGSQVQIANEVVTISPGIGSFIEDLQLDYHLETFYNECNKHVETLKAKIEEQKNKVFEYAPSEYRRMMITLPDNYKELYNEKTLKQIGFEFDNLEAGQTIHNPTFHDKVGLIEKSIKTLYETEVEIEAPILSFDNFKSVNFRYKYITDKGVKRLILNPSSDYQTFKPSLIIKHLIPA